MNIAPSRSPAQARPTAASAVKNPESRPFVPPWKGAWGSFLFSACIHATVLILISGTVIMKGIVPRNADFIASTVTGEEDVEVLEMPPGDLSEPMPEVPTLSTEVASLDESTEPQESADIIIASVPSPTFNLAPAVGNPQSNQLLTRASASRANSGGGGGGGGPGIPGKMSSLFGGQGSAAGLVGTFYDPMRTDKGESTGRAPNYDQFLQQFSRNRGNAKDVFKDFWKSETALSASYLAVPQISTLEAFESFGSKPADGNRQPPFFVHYTAQVAPPESGTFRFAGFADNWMIVMINGKVVFMGDNDYTKDPNPAPDKKTTGGVSGWQSPEPVVYMHPAFPGYNIRYTFGDWIEWPEEEFKKIDILIGDNGQAFKAALFIQKQGVNYSRQREHDTPVLPLFRVADHKDELGALHRLRFEEAGGSKELIFKTR